MNVCVSEQGPQQGVIEGDFSICISLYHGYELLQQMGVRSLFLFIQNIFSGPRGAQTLTLVSPDADAPLLFTSAVFVVFSESARVRNELQRSPVFMDLYREMESMFTTASRGLTNTHSVIIYSSYAFLSSVKADVQKNVPAAL